LKGNKKNPKKNRSCLLFDPNEKEPAPGKGEKTKKKTEPKEKGYGNTSERSTTKAGRKSCRACKRSDRQSPAKRERPSRKVRGVGAISLLNGRKEKRGLNITKKRGNHLN